MTAPAAQPLRRARAGDSAACQRRALRALDQLEAKGATISFPAVARTAKVARSTLYTNPALRDAIHQRRAAQQERRRVQRTSTPHPDLGDWQVRARNAEEDVRQLGAENAKLQRRVLQLEATVEDLRDDLAREADNRVLDLLRDREVDRETIRQLADEVSDLQMQLAAARERNRFLARSAAK